MDTQIAQITEGLIAKVAKTGATSYTLGTMKDFRQANPKLSVREAKREFIKLRKASALNVVDGLKAGVTSGAIGLDRAGVNKNGDRLSVAFLTSNHASMHDKAPKAKTKAPKSTKVDELENKNIELELRLMEAQEIIESMKKAEKVA